MIKAILSTLLVFCLFGHQAFAVAQFETEAPEPVGSEFQDVVFHLDGFFSEELSILSDKEVQIAELYVISESNEQFLIQNHVTRFANEHTVDIDGRGLSHIVAKVRARDYAGANLKLVSKQIHQLPKASFDFAYTPHSEHTWNIKSLKQNMTADRLTLKNVGARGKVYELYVNYGGEEPGTIVYLSKDQSLNPQLSRTVLSTGKELVVTLDGTRPIESVFFRGDSHVSGQDTVMEVSFQTDEIKMPGPTASFDFVRFRAPHTNHTWNLSQAKFKSPTLSATGSVSGRITVMVVNYADGTSDDLVAQAREDNNHIEPKNGRLDVRLNETQGMTINLKLDPEKYIESVEMTADSWKSGSSLVLDLELDPINELVHTYMVEQGNREVSKWELDPDANTSSVKSISINALDADVTVQDFKVNFSSGRSQNILAAGNETFLRLAGEQRVRTYQITSREAVSSVEVTASTGSPSPVRLRVSLNQGELAPLKDFCKDKLGRIHRSNTGELWRVQIEDAVSNRCTAGGVDNYYFRQWQNQFCESGAVRNAQIDVEQTHYNSDGASCVPTVTSPNPAPAACTANVQGRDARMFYSQQFWSDDQSLDPAGNRLPIEDRLVSVEKSCPWDEGGRDYYFKTYLHECGSDSDGDGKGEIRLVSRDQEQRGRRYGEHIACPAPRDCTKADHGFTWQELLGSIDTEEEPCRFDDGVIRKSYEEIIIHTCENGDIKAGSSVETRKDFPRSQCYVDPDGSGYCDPNASCDPRPSGF
ncbi:MAG: hypothetical protein HRT45_04460, partial [Bdellovibrionales bacterium]|nr:hypothetical protein [Bdellovibrionales bacterium]